MIILDEINRSNFTAVFGEVMQILNDTQKTVTLPLSGTELQWQDSLILFATMSQADMTLGSLDMAVRRRFMSIEVNPDSTSISGKRAELMDQINGIIEKQLGDKRRLLGQSYFLHKSEQDIIEQVYATLVNLCRGNLHLKKELHLANQILWIDSTKLNQILEGLKING